MSSWTAFWDRPNSIYVNSTHLAAHFRRLATDFLALLPARSDVLDFGCGEALEAARFTAAGHRLTLYDASQETTRRLQARFATQDAISVLDETSYQRLANGSFGAILASSVVQYVPRDSLPALLARWRSLLRPGGILIVADVIPPATSAVEDAVSLLRFAAQNGFLPAACLGLVRTAFSDYSRLRRELGLARYGAEEFASLLQAAGFSARRLDHNPGPSPHRLGFLGTAR